MFELVTFHLRVNVHQKGWKASKVFEKDADETPLNQLYLPWDKDQLFMLIMTFMWIKLLNQKCSAVKKIPSNDSYDSNWREETRKAQFLFMRK